MSDAADIADPAERMLDRLAELDLALAERLHAAAMAAEAPEVAVDLARAYQRVARSLRQTLALKAKLKQDRAREPREPAPPPKPGGHAIRNRIRDLRTAITRVIWNEAEGPGAADWLQELAEEDITLQCLSDDFVSEPLDDHVARLAAALGLSTKAARAWRDLPDPEPGPAVAPAPKVRSSG